MYGTEGADDARIAAVHDAGARNESETGSVVGDYLRCR